MGEFAVSRDFPGSVTAGDLLAGIMMRGMNAGVCEKGTTLRVVSCDMGEWLGDRRLMFAGACVTGSAARVWEWLVSPPNRG